MEQSLSWEPNRSSATQEIPRIVWYLKVHYLIHKSPPSVPILSQIDPVHTLHPHLTSRRSVLILSSHLRLGLSSGLLPSGVTTKPCMHLSCPPYMFRPFQSPWLDHPNDIWWVQSIKLFVMQSSPLPCYLIPLGSKYPPQHSILENAQPTFLPHCEQPSCYIYI